MLLLGAGLVYLALQFRPTALNQPEKASQSPIALKESRSAHDAPTTGFPAEEPIKPAAFVAAIPSIADNEIARAVLREIQRVVRPGRAAWALFDDGQRRLACLLVENAGHFYQLDYGLKPENFAALRSGKFTAPNSAEPISKTISIYRSLAKRAMHYRATGEDRLIVLLCPADEWPSLDLQYADFNPGPLPGDGDLQPDLRF